MHSTTDVSDIVELSENNAKKLIARCENICNIQSNLIYI